MNWIESYEKFLKIPSDTPTEHVVRYRAIWLVGSTFVVMQMLNMITMTINYRTWTYDHTVALVAGSGVFICVNLLRWYKNYHVYAAMFSIFLFLAMSASALPDNAGVNTALIPLLIVGPLVNGYVSGRRAAILFWAAAMIYMLFLGWVSFSNPSQWASGERHRDFNRLANGMFILSISAMLSAMLTEHTYTALRTTRENAERAIKAEAAQAEFLAKMSHELRTPLNGVIGLTDALVNSNLPKREAELAKTIRKSGDSLLLILNDLLDLSKIEAGKMPINLAPVNAMHAVESAIQGWNEVARDHGLSFSSDFDPDLDDGALLDELRLRQIIHNLLSNAMKFTESGQVRLKARRERRKNGEQKLVLRVADTGCGIGADAADRIFDSFEQEVNDGVRRHSGTGLGLPISRMLAELMGGSLELEYTGPKGSIFVLVLPFHPAEIEVESVTTEPFEAPISSLRVLIVEDHEINTLVLTEYLKILEVSYEVARDGVECLGWLERSDFDVILMDKNMPRMNGAQATRAIRESSKPYSNVPIIAVTADAMVGEKERLIATGMNGYISKPIQIDDLSRILAEQSVRTGA